ncbi:MAG: NAD kinase [Saprospiraceae bacterium]|nr:NAD kinase [Saprospiraceae bacterium]
MKVLIYGKTVLQSQVESIQLLFDLLHGEEAKILVFGPYLKQIEPLIAIPGNIEEIRNYLELVQHRPDFVFTLGGDGTILSAATLIRDSNIPIVGINLGRLGFLASIEEKVMKEAFQMIRHNKYRLEERSMIYLDSSQPIFGENLFALNDFTILKRDNSSMIIIHAFINGEFLNSYWADGLIVSTPTGSTGYSLSCGGPIVFPDSHNFIITPVAPHNLNVRPLVISDTSVISFEVEGRTENFLCTLDSRFELITQEFKLSIRKCEFGIRLVQLEEMSFSKTMRNKLMWGHDTRKHY